MNKYIKLLLPTWIARRITQARITYRSVQPIASRECNICKYRGYFGIMGRPPRLDARCPACESLERHRLMMLGLDRDYFDLDKIDSPAVLHFAAEPILEKIFRQKWSNYRTADLFVEKADLKLNLESIELPDNSIDLIIANHFLEHVDDYKASIELNRILVAGGTLLCMVPIVEGWDETYENESVKSGEDRWLHFGQNDHLRYFGKDFRSRIEKVGFKLVEELTAEGNDVIQYGLLRGEKVFVFRKN